MKNAHLRLRMLCFRKVMREGALDVRVWLDRLIAEGSPPAAAPGLAQFGAVARRSARRPTAYSDETQLSLGF